MNEEVKDTNEQVEETTVVDAPIEENKVEEIKVETTPVDNSQPKEKEQVPPTNNGSNTVPPVNNQGPKVIYVEKPRKPFPWKTVGKYAFVFLFAGLCGFGGGLLANYVDRQKTQTTTSEYDYSGNSLPSIPYGYSDNGSSSDSDSGSSSSGSTQKQNTNKAALGVKVTEKDDGVYVAGFSTDSNAESAGIKIGDKITAIDGNEYSTYNDIVTYIGTKDVGDTVEVTVERDGEEKKISVELGERSTETSLPSSSDSSVY